MRTAAVERISELAENDPRIFLITADLGFGVLTEFAGRFPDQYLNVGVAEQNMTGVATGMALEGYTVFTYSIANFPTIRCLEQVRNDVCYHNVNVNIIAVGGGLSYGSLGYTHHATEDLSIMRSLPGLVVMAPGDRWEAAESVSALVEKNGPGYLRLDKQGAEVTGGRNRVFQLGKMRRLRDGGDVTLISTGGILSESLKAVEALERQGVSCRLLSAPTVKPLDREEILKAAAETRLIVTIEENTVEAGFGSAVAEVLLESETVHQRLLRIGLKDDFHSIIGSQEHLRARLGLDGAGIAEKTLQRLKGRAAQ